MDKKLWFYFILAYLLSWLVFIPLALQGQGLISGLPAWLHMLGAFGPLLAAFIVTLAAHGWAGLRGLLRRMVLWRIGLIWWLAALSPLLVYLVVVSVIGIFSGDWSGLSRFGQVSEIPGLPWWAGWLVWILTYALGEETGWRGFALPRLQKSYSARRATLILGGFWAAWHIPTFFYNYEMTVVGLILFTVGILSGAVLLTWLYNSTGGSLLAVIIWHGTYNAAVASGGALVSALVSMAVILAAIVIGNRYGPETLSHREKQVH
ncbi:MAG: CPBP family intramembrane metalloprotease [Anaerolineales bacterium]|nr:CPBP family intramembrane metalloprotease [Anaerolineales bacterium]